MCLMCKRREYAFQVLATVSVLFEIVSFALFIAQHYTLPFTNFKLVARTERRRQNCTFQNLSLSFCVSSSELGTIPLAENMVDVIWCHIMVWCYNMVSCIMVWCYNMVSCIMAWCYNMVSCCIMVWCYGVVVWCYNMVSCIMVWCYMVSLWCDVIIWCHYGVML